MDKATLWNLCRAGFQWWLAGIQILIPAALRARWFPQPDSLEASRDGDSLELTHRAGVTGAVLTVKRTSLRNPLSATETAAWLAAQVPATAHVLVRIAREQVLSRTLQLPLAVEPDLRSMLELELDRLTPFACGDVYLDVQVCRRSPESLTCRFALVKRVDLDPVLHALTLLGRPAHAVHIEPPFEVNLDLLPGEQRPQGDVRGRQRTVFAFGLAMALFLAALYAPLIRQESLLADWQHLVEQQREVAGTAQTLLAQRGTLEGRSQFVAERRVRKQPMVETLAELTERMPDPAWVNRLLVQGSEVQLFGEAESATALVPLLESSELFQKVEFRAPTTRHEATGKDRFHIGLRLTSAGASP